MTDPDTADRTTAAHPRDAFLRAHLAETLGDPEAVDAAFAEPERDLVDLGLSSLNAFALLEEMIERGVDVDFLDFTAEPTVAFLRSVDPGVELS